MPLPKKGKLLTFTLCQALPGDFEVPELKLGIVELQDGTRVTGQLDMAAPKIGMKVEADIRVVRKYDYNQYYGMVFRPAGVRS